MSYPLEKLKTLRDLLRLEELHCTGFFYSSSSKYKYFVLVEDIKNLKKKSKFALVLLTFVNLEDTAKRYITEASSACFCDINIKEFFKFIKEIDIKPTQENINSFYENLNNFIPSELSEINNVFQKRIILSSLSQRDGDNPNAIYCYSIYRNGRKNKKQINRTIFNSNRAKLLVPNLYELFKNDKTIGFRFSPKRKMAKTDEQLLEQFYKNSKIQTF